jgi:hypothetical protein
MNKREFVFRAHIYIEIIGNLTFRNRQKSRTDGGDCGTKEEFFYYQVFTQSTMK